MRSLIDGVSGLIGHQATWPDVAIVAIIGAVVLGIVYCVCKYVF